MYNHLFKTDYDPNSGFSQARLAEEKSFAEKCFEAGRAYQNAENQFSKTGINHTIPNFYGFYSQFETILSSIDDHFKIENKMCITCEYTQFGKFHTPCSLCFKKSKYKTSINFKNT